MTGIVNSVGKAWVETLSKNDPSNRAEYNKALEQVRANYMQVIISISQTLLFPVPKRYFEV